MTADPESPITFCWANYPPLTVAGRQARTMRKLLDCGPRGFTPIEADPPGCRYRWSGYIGVLRAKGVPIDTPREGPSKHGRYRLTVPITVISGGGDD